MSASRRIALVDIDALGGIDPRRLVRALRLTVERIERGRYLTRSSRGTHYVDLIDPLGERCDCPDWLWRDAVCQHLLACLLREGDERVLGAMTAVVARLIESNQELRREIAGAAIRITSRLKADVARATRLHSEDLLFQRDPDGSTADIAVHHRAGGARLGIVTRRTSAPSFRLDDMPEDTSTWPTSEARRAA